MTKKIQKEKKTKEFNIFISGHFRSLEMFYLLVFLSFYRKVVRGYSHIVVSFYLSQHLFFLSFIEEGGERVAMQFQHLSFIFLSFYPFMKVVTGYSHIVLSFYLSQHLILFIFFIQEGGERVAMQLQHLSFIFLSFYPFILLYFLLGRW